MSASRLTDDDLLFDTNAASALIRRTPELLEAISSDSQVLLPLAVVGELLYGAHHADNPTRQTERVLALIGRAEIILPDLATAQQYARVKSYLRRTRRMIPDNDLWITATALQSGLLLVTRDSHFDSVPGIRTLGWRTQAALLMLARCHG